MTTTSSMTVKLSMTAADFRVLKLQKGDSIKYLKQDIEYGLPVERFEIITIGGEKVTESLPCPIL